MILKRVPVDEVLSGELHLLTLEQQDLKKQSNRQHFSKPSQQSKSANIL